MNAAALPGAAALNQRFLLDYPHEAARLLESMPAAEAAAVLAPHPAHAVVRAWQALGPDVATGTRRNASGDSPRWTRRSRASWPGS
jgi:hypothetical protein